MVEMETMDKYMDVGVPMNSSEHGLSWYLTPMGIVTSSVLGALPAPTPLTRKVLARLW